MLETAWESRWLPGLLKIANQRFAFIYKSPLKAAIIREAKELTFLMIEGNLDQDSNLKTSYSREKLIRTGFVQI